MTTATLDGSFVRENFARISSRLSGRFRELLYARALACFPSLSLRSVDGRGRERGVRASCTYLPRPSSRPWWRRGPPLDQTMATRMKPAHWSFCCFSFSCVWRPFGKDAFTNAAGQKPSALLNWNALDRRRKLLSANDAESVFCVEL